MSDLTTEERVRRTRLALAEELPVEVLEVAVYASKEGPRYVRGLIPPALIWRSAMVTTREAVVKCWPCWDQRSTLIEDPCGHDPLTSPWPEVVR